MTVNEAMAEAVIVLPAECFVAVTDGTSDVLATARVAGIMAAKKTSELIPLAQPVPLAELSIDFEPLADRHAIRIVAMVKPAAQASAETEALIAASIAALTVHDMVKTSEKSAIILSIRLLTKPDDKIEANVGPRKSRVERAVADRPRVRARPALLSHETAPPVPAADPNADREAFRNFMVSRQLRATDWAKQAGVPASQIYSYLTGRSRGLSQDVVERLARAARARVEDMFARGR